MFPAIIMFCCVGSYASMNSVFSVWLMLGWGVAGYFFKKVGVQPAPLILGFVLGPLLEENFRRSMVVSNGSFAVFFERPISAVFLGLAIVFVIALLLPAIRGKREILKEED
jgi:TctA family transporter